VIFVTGLTLPRLPSLISYDTVCRSSSDSGRDSGIDNPAIRIGNSVASFKQGLNLLAGSLVLAPHI